MICLKSCRTLIALRFRVGKAGGVIISERKAQYVVFKLRKRLARVGKSSADIFRFKFAERFVLPHMLVDEIRKHGIGYILCSESAGSHRLDNCKPSESLCIVVPEKVYLPLGNNAVLFEEIHGAFINAPVFFGQDIAVLLRIFELTLYVVRVVHIIAVPFIGQRS